MLFNIFFVLFHANHLMIAASPQPVLSIKAQGPRSAGSLYFNVICPEESNRDN